MFSCNRYCAAQCPPSIEVECSAETLQPDHAHEQVFSNITGGSPCSTRRRSLPPFMGYRLPFLLPGEGFHVQLQRWHSASLHGIIFGTATSLHTARLTMGTWKTSGAWGPIPTCPSSLAGGNAALGHTTGRILLFQSLRVQFQLDDDNPHSIAVPTLVP